jgi:hypothetical protein
MIKHLRLVVDYSGGGFFLSKIESNVIGATALTVVITYDKEDVDLRLYSMLPFRDTLIVTTEEKWKQRINAAIGIIAEYEPPQGFVDHEPSLTDAAMAVLGKLQAQLGKEPDDGLTQPELPFENEQDAPPSAAPASAKTRKKREPKPTPQEKSEVTVEESTPSEQVLPDTPPVGKVSDLAQRDDMDEENFDIPPATPLVVAKPPQTAQATQTPVARTEKAPATEKVQPVAFNVPKTGPKGEEDLDNYRALLSSIKGEALVAYAKQCGITDAIIAKFSDSDAKLRGVLLGKYKSLPV